MTMTRSLSSRSDSAIRRPRIKGIRRLYQSEPDLDFRKISRRDGVALDGRVVCAGRTADDVKSPGVAIATEWNLSSHGGIGDARQRTDPLHNCIAGAHHRFVFAIALAAHRNLHRQHMIGIEARMDAEQATDASNHQTRTGEQHHSERDVDRDQHSPGG